MRSTLRLAVTLLAIMALVLIAATSIVAANPHTMYTCTKTTNGKTDVKTSVPEPAVDGLTQAGYACVAEADEGHQGDQGSQGDQGQQGDHQGEDTGEGNESTPGDDSETNLHDSFLAVPVDAPSESRSLYCSTKGDGTPVALDLPDSQGALLVEQGLATPGIFYAGIGVSCDRLPGFTYAGVWVDHIGEVVPGVAVYPYYVPTTS